jgi:hypothetical protein
MHVTEKIVDDNGVHILSSTLEADGAFALASEKAKLDAKVIAVRRTDSGGVFVQTAVAIDEPVPEAVSAPEPEKPAPTPEELAAEYLKEKGKSDDEAKGMIERFGAAKILQKKTAERQAELDALLASPKAPTPPADPKA